MEIGEDINVSFYNCVLIYIENSNLVKGLFDSQ